jgi:hypothetical protein
LGVVLYEMVTGRKPYTADTPAAILLKQANEPLPRPKIFAQNLPDEIEKVLIKALAKKPNDRYQNMGEFVVALVKLLGGQTVSIVQNAQTQSDYAQATVVQFTGSFDTQATIDQGPKLPKPAQEARDKRDKIYPRWRAVFWIALGWTIGYVIVGAFSVAIESVAIIGAFIGMTGGFCTILVLRKEKILLSWKSVLWITLIWAASWAIGLKVGVTSVTIVGAIGGFGMALVLRNERAFSDWKSVLWITLGWAIGWAFFSGIGYVIGYVIPWVITLPIGVAIGGAIMIWRLRKESKP